MALASGGNYTDHTCTINVSDVVVSFTTKGH